MSHQGIHNGSSLYNAVENSYEFISHFFTLATEVAFIIDKQCSKAQFLHPHSPAVQNTYIH